MDNLPIFFCGPHCSGKTSILKDLHKEGLLSEIGLEIGKELFYQRHIDTASQGEEFEKEITQMEIKRDVEYAKRRGTIGIESWHSGNLAYAMVRNQSVVPYLLQEIKKSPMLPLAYGICFHVSWENIFLRTQTFKGSQKWAADFYTQIGSCLNECLNHLGLMEKCVFVDANRPYGDVYSDVRMAVKNLCESSYKKPSHVQMQ